MGSEWCALADKSEAETDLSHDFLVLRGGPQDPLSALSNIRVAYEQIPCVSGLRVFGLDEGEKPSVPKLTAVRTGTLDMECHDRGPAGYRGIQHPLWSAARRNCITATWSSRAKTQRVGALVKDREYYVRVDAFNEQGITEGICSKLV